MTTTDRHIFAFSGILKREGDARSNADLTNYAIGLARKSAGVRVCYVPTAVGDSPLAVKNKAQEFSKLRPDVEFSALTLFNQPNVPDIRAHLLRQDMILVEGGSVANLMAIWRVHGVDEIMRECWEAGVVLAGASAGSICWHTGGPTDSFGDSLTPFTDGLALLPFSNGVHDDFREQSRRDSYRQMIANGILASGYATEDGVGLHFVGTELEEAVSIRPVAKAWKVWATSDGSFCEEVINPRLL